MSRADDHFWSEHLRATGMTHEQLVERLRELDTRRSLLDSRRAEIESQIAELDAQVAEAYATMPELRTVLEPLLNTGKDILKAAAAQDAANEAELEKLAEKAEVCLPAPMSPLNLSLGLSKA